MRAADSHKSWNKDGKHYEEAHTHLVVPEYSLIVHSRLGDNYSVAVPLLLQPQAHVLLTPGINKKAVTFKYIYWTL